MDKIKKALHPYRTKYLYSVLPPNLDRKIYLTLSDTEIESYYFDILSL